MSDKSNEYDILFRKFYGDLFKYQTGKKNAMKCKGCNTDKRFIINNDELIFSCGPKNNPNKKCGIQYTIKLPKYVKFSDLYEIYNENIHGSMKYNKDVLGYDLETLSQKMNVSKELESQKILIKDSTEKLKRLTEDYIQTNKLDEYIETLEKLSEMRYKNSIEKSKIMRSLNEDELSEPEKIVLRKKYAQCIKENRGFIEIINKLNRENSDYIMIKNPECIIHTNKLNLESDKVITKKIDKVKVTMKVRWSILYVMYKINGLQIVSIKDLYKNIPMLRDITEGLFEHGNAEPEIRTRVSEMNRDGYIKRIGIKGSGKYKITEKGNKYLDEFNKEFNINK
tara:strand:- start:5303 stop:6319 length:1017 start_codon:yes stop_codon:yes gene_type:complete